MQISRSSVLRHSLSPAMALLMLIAAVEVDAQSSTTTTQSSTTSTSVGSTTSTTIVSATTHLKCYKVKDPLKLRGPRPSWLELEGPDVGLEHCRIVGGFRLACAPVSMVITAPIDGRIGTAPLAPLTPTPLASEEVLVQERLCYRIRCEEPPGLDAQTIFTDQFATRRLSSFKPFILCGPATTSLCGDGNLDLGEGCDDGNTTKNDCCDSSCQPEAAGKISGCVDTDGNICTEAACDGFGACVQDAILPGNTKSCLDSDGNVCTGARCDGAGGCDQNGFFELTTKVCPDTDGNDCTQARCNGGGGCNQLGIIRADGSSCGDTDGNACTQAACDGAAVCEQDFFVRNCTSPETCNPATGECE